MSEFIFGRIHYSEKLLEPDIRFRASEICKEISSRGMRIIYGGSLEQVLPIREMLRDVNFFPLSPTMIPFMLTDQNLLDVSGGLTQRVQLFAPDQNEDSIPSFIEDIGALVRSAFHFQADAVEFAFSEGYSAVSDIDFFEATFEDWCEVLTAKLAGQSELPSVWTFIRKQN